MQAVMELKDVSKTYVQGGQQIKALDHVTLTVERGEFLAVVGRSGSGKSTLMNMLGCLDTPTQGSYVFAGEEVAGLSDRRLAEIRNRKIGFVFQGFNLIGGLSALENVELPLAYRGVPRRERRAMALEALELVGLGGRVEHRPGQMSGGQQQRVAIARAIAARPPVILADEPTANLNLQAGQAVMDILQGLNRQGRTLVLITHDREVARLAGRRVCIRGGRISNGDAP